jgi:phage recombination protein Bet
MATAPASTALATLTQALATKLNMGDGVGLIETLKATAFKSKEGVSDAQMTALMVVANQYGLNPWVKEIYAYPDKQNGIVPVVGVDGWVRIINSNPQFDGMDFEQDEDSCTCVIHRKDRNHPIKVTEYLSECYRPAFKNKEGYEIKGPWQSHPKRMLRHKAMIQCARLTFGFGGIYDDDEAARIVDMGEADVVAPINMPKPKSMASQTSQDAPTQPAKRDTTQAVLAREPEQEIAPKPAQETQRETTQETKRETKRATTTFDADTGEVLDEPLASKGFLAHVLAKATEIGVDHSAIWDRFGITTLEGITQPHAAEILVWVKAQ